MGAWRRSGRHVARFGLAAAACIAGVVLWAGPAGANYYTPQIKIDFLGFPTHTTISTEGVAHIKTAQGGVYRPNDPGRSVYEQNSNCARWHGDGNKKISDGKKTGRVGWAGGGEGYSVVVGKIEIENDSFRCTVEKSRSLVLVKEEPSGKVLAVLNITQSGGVRAFYADCFDAASGCSEKPVANLNGHVSGYDSEWTYAIRPPG